MASLIGRVQDFVIEHGEVQGKTKTDWMSWGEVSLGNFGRILVSFQGFVGRLLALVTDGELSEITMVVTLPRWNFSIESRRISEIVARLNVHLVVEDLGFSALGGRNQVLIKNLEDILTDLCELGFDLLTVFLDQSDLRAVSFRLLLLLD